MGTHLPSTRAAGGTGSAGAAPGRRLPLREVLRRGAAWAADYAWIVDRQARALLRPPAADRWSDGPGAPVLLVPGIYETWGVMAPLAQALHSAGHPVHAVPSLGFNEGDLAWSAGQVADRLAELDLRGAVLVAHSKGGLIGKLALTLPRTGGRAVGLVAVNTPFAGSSYARWFPLRAVRALSPRDPHLLALAAQLPVNARVVTVHSRFDPHVPGDQRLEGAVDVPLPVDGHFRVLSSPLVHREVAHAVGTLAEAARVSPGGPRLAEGTAGH
ncbi:esterase/lipase family protein [Cellulomonas endophytica]|uniref:esterase/lipase family protein n=1 Tax=Cellulomonas endophytica TaxID=2494735 RepID=UPI00196A45EA|nr:alpha/beta hydrolase [Cellulomonas endophytica]